MQLRFEPVLKRSRKRRPRALEAAELAGISPVDAAQLRLDRGRIDTQATAFADDRASVHNHIAQQRRVTSREQKFNGIDRHDLVAIKAIEIDGNEICWRARYQCTRSRRTGGFAAVGDGKAEKFRRRPGAFEAETA